MNATSARTLRSGITNARADADSMTRNGYTKISVGWNGRRRDRAYFDAYSRTIGAMRYRLALEGIASSSLARTVTLERFK